MDKNEVYKLILDNLKNIYGYCFARLYNKEQVEDLSSEIVYELLISADNINNKDAFFGFLWKVADNTFYKFIKKEKRYNSLSELNDEIPVESFKDEIIEKEDLKYNLNLLRRELSLLNKTNREITVAYYMDNKSCSTIAKEFNISLEMVKYHLFKTRKLLKEGIGMERQLGEKSYNPGVFRLNFWGDQNRYYSICNRKLPGSILLAAYNVAMSKEELSMELGVSMPYLEEELQILINAGLINEKNNKYQTNLVILTSDYEEELAKNSKSIYIEKSKELFDKLVSELSLLRKYYSGYDDNYILWNVLTVIFNKAFDICKEKVPYGNPKALKLGGYGHLWGHDNDFNYLKFSGVYNVDTSPDFYCNITNYKIISNCQNLGYSDFFNNSKFLHAAIFNEQIDEYSNCNYNFIKIENGIAKANFKVFEKEEYQSIIEKLSPLIEEVSNLMNYISDMAKLILIDHCPQEVKEQCDDISKITVRLDVTANLVEEMVNQKLLDIPKERQNICAFAYKR